MEGGTTRSAIEASGSTADAAGEVDVAAPAPKVKETRESCISSGEEERNCVVAPLLGTHTQLQQECRRRTRRGGDERENVVFPRGRWFEDDENGERGPLEIRRVSSQAADAQRRGRGSRQYPPHDEQAEGRRQRRSEVRGCGGASKR